MHKSKLKQISLAVCLALMPYSSFAAGLGKINVSSGLGEPLKAEVELLSVSPDELSTIVATIASEDAYAAQGIARLSIHNSIKIELSKNANGSPVLKLRSNQPISDPYLDMLIELDWASGRLLRDYTILLDPPGYKQTVDQAVSTSAVSPAVSMPVISESLKNDASANANNAKKSKIPLQQAQVKPHESIDEQKLITKRGDTLISIAKKTQVDGVGLDQMLVGLYESNKDAFISSNMNRLKVGKIIKVPTRESLVSIDAQQAKQSIKVHSSNWNAYRNSLAAAVETTPAMVENEHKQTSSGKITTAEDKAAPVKSGPQDVVRLSAGEKDLAKSNKEAGMAADAKVIALQEEATAREKTLKEAQDRASALEKQIQDMQKLLALKSQAMLDLQKNAEIKTSSIVQADKANVASTPDTKSSEEAKPVADSMPKAVAEVKKPVEPTKVQPVQPESPQVEVSWLDSLMNAVDLTILGGASGVALLGAAWMFLRNKRRKDLDSFERGILTSGGLRANTVFGNTTGSTSSADTSFLTDFAQSANGSMIDANDVDPIAEAEVYMAYGRDAQAEEILKDAISKEPKRYELHLKLLEMYASQRAASAFEAVAGELYTTLGAEDPTWIKIAEMGATFEPDNPLYKVSKSVRDVPSEDKKLDASDFSDVAISSDDSLDFVLGDEVVTNTQPAAESSDVMDMSEFSSSALALDDALDMDLNDTNSLETTFPEISDESESINESVVSESFSLDSKSDDVIDFNLDSPNSDLAEDITANLSESAAEESVVEEALSLDSATDKVMDFDLGDFNLSSETSVDIASDEASDSLPAFDFTGASNDGLDTVNFDLPVSNDVDSKADVDGTEGSGDGLADFNMEFSLPADQADIDSKRAVEAVASTISDISFDLDASPEELPKLGSDIDLSSEDSAITFDLPVDVLHDSDSSNEVVSDVDVGIEDVPEALPTVDFSVQDEPEVIAPSKSELSSNELDINELDLSSISLDLDDELPESDVEQVSLDAGLPDIAGLESQDVEVKLDLVAAYIDMDDTEGARELLEEVLKEGGPQQQLRAQQLLESLV
ncbi:hypothetical protein GALL_61360 [mine drainage metagenome]|uniref:FimV N-terminal domain-containing protein n=1 Tax=mine drainage metagenome TaxID=410659 RepID=A0A1J5T809_9ZZZZ